MAITSPVVRQAKFLKAFSNLQTHNVKATWQQEYLKSETSSMRGLDNHHHNVYETDMYQGGAKTHGRDTVGYYSAIIMEG